MHVSDETKHMWYVTCITVNFSIVLHDNNPKKSLRYGFAAACLIVKGSLHVMCVKTFLHNGFLSPPTIQPTPYMYLPLLGFFL